MVYSERGRHNGMSAESITVWFHRLYGSLGMDGCSSHSGRRTFVTKAARKIVEAGGSPTCSNSLATGRYRRLRATLTRTRKPSAASLR